MAFLKPQAVFCEGSEILSRGFNLKLSGKSETVLVTLAMNRINGSLSQKRKKLYVVMRVCTFLCAC